MICLFVNQFIEVDHISGEGLAMKLTLTWTTSSKTLPLFDVEISQEEGSFARAKLLIEALAPLPTRGTEGTLKTEEEGTLFKGVLESIPHKLVGHFAEIELIAKPRDFVKQLDNIQKELKVHPFWDPLYVPPEKVNQNEDRQDVKQISLYCDRRTGHLTQSDWFKGRQLFDIKGNFFEDSLQIKTIGKPLKSCSVNVKTSWIQKQSGIANLSPAIRRAFPHHKVNTYTNNALTDKWPETGKRIGRSGVWILKSKLRSVNPPSSLYPKFSPQLLLEDTKGIIKNHKVKRHWFKPTLWVCWQAPQKRREKIRFTLNHESYPGDGDHTHLTFTLQNINPDPKAYPWQPAVFYEKGDKICYGSSLYRCHTAHTSSLTFDEKNWTYKKNFHTPLGNPARASFFLTERGYQAFEHALECAHSELKKSIRTLEISFEASWDTLKSITTDSSVELEDPRLPTGKVKGKVVKYALIVKGETGERYGRVTLLCPQDRVPLQRNAPPSKPLYVLDSYCEETYHVQQNHLRQTPTGIHYFRYDEQGPPALRYVSPLHGLELINGPLEQEADMRTHKTSSSLKKAMARKSTRLRFHFNDLRTKDCIEHDIQCDVMGV